MAAKLTRLTHKIAIQLDLAKEICTVCSFRSRRPVRKLSDRPSHCHPSHLWLTQLTSSQLQLPARAVQGNQNRTLQNFTAVHCQTIL
jgi:hypothetical protein